MVKLPPAGAFRQKRLVLGFPEAALLKSAVSYNGHGWLEPLPDLSASDISEQITLFLESDGTDSGIHQPRKNRGRDAQLRKKLKGGPNEIECLDPGV